MLFRNNKGVMMKWFGWIGGLGIALAAAADPAFIDFEQSWILPQDFGGLKYEISEKYEEEAFGYRVLYRDGESFEAEVTIYDLEYDSITNGCTGERIDGVLRGMEEALELRKKRGEITDLKKLRTAVTPKGENLQFATVIFVYKDLEAEGAKKLQTIYLTGIQNQFLRLQFTFDQAKKAKALERVNKMISGLSKMATAQPSQEEILLGACSVFLNDPYSYGGLSSAKYLMGKTKEVGDLSVYTHLFVWPTGYWSKPKNADLLIAAYFAGMLQVVIPQKLDEGGDFEAFSAMLDTYKVLRSKEQIDDIPKIGEWAENPDRRALYDQLLIIEE